MLNCKSIPIISNRHLLYLLYLLTPIISIISIILYLLYLLYLIDACLTERRSYGLSKIIYYIRQLHLSQMPPSGISLASRRPDRCTFISKTQWSVKSDEPGASEMPSSMETDLSFVLQSRER